MRVGEDEQRRKEKIEELMAPTMMLVMLMKRTRCDTGRVNALKRFRRLGTVTKK